MPSSISSNFNLRSMDLWLITNNGWYSFVMEIKIIFCRWQNWVFSASQNKYILLCWKGNPSAFLERPMNTKGWIRIIIRTNFRVNTSIIKCKMTGIQHSVKASKCKNEDCKELTLVQQLADDHLKHFFQNNIQKK